MRLISKSLVANLRKHLVLVILIAISLGYAGTVTVLHRENLSPVDEWVYIDYLYKMPNQGMVHEGETVGPQTLHALTCDGVIPGGRFQPHCGSVFSDMTVFPNGGISSAAPYTPLYFATALVAGAAIHWATGLEDLTSWRLSGALWLAASMLVMYLLFRQWGVKWHATLALGLAFIASPFSYWTYTYVSTDAPSFFFGALLLYLAVGYVRGQRSGWWLPIVSVLAVLTKVTNIMAVELVALYLVIEFIRRQYQNRHGAESSFLKRVLGKQTGGLILFPVLALGASAALEMVWLKLVPVLAVSSARANQGVSSQLGVTKLLKEVINFLPGTITYSPIAQFLPSFAFTALNWIVIAGVLGAFFSLRLRKPSSSVVIPIVIGAVTLGPLLAITLQVMTNSYFELPSRYGAPLLAGFLLLGGLILRNRAASALIGVYAVGLLVVGVGISELLARHFA